MPVSGSVLLVTAHPDDAASGLGAWLRVRPRECRVTIACATEASNFDWPAIDGRTDLSESAKHEMRAAIRLAEGRAEADEYDADFVAMRLAFYHLVRSGQGARDRPGCVPLEQVPAADRRRFDDFLARARPDVVFSPGDLHPTHQTVRALCDAAIRKYASAGSRPLVGYYQTYDTFVVGTPNAALLFTQRLQEDKQAVLWRCHLTQRGRTAPDLPGVVRCRRTMFEAVCQRNREDAEVHLMRLPPSVRDRDRWRYAELLHWAE